MTVCKFWLNNSCKYGSSCRFEHPPKDGSQPGLFGSNNNWQGGGGGQRVSFQSSFGNNNSSSNPYKWVAGQPQGTQETNARPASDVVNDLAAEMTTWERSKLWPFSCIAPENGLPSLPDFQDTSVEEMRLEAYQAKEQGSMQSYLQRVQSLAADFQNKRQQLKNMTPDLQRTLVQFVNEGRKQKQSQSVSGQPFSASSSSSSSDGLFGKPAGGSLFVGSSTFGTSGGGQSSSVFGGGGTATQGSSLFGGGSSSPGNSSSVFGGGSATGNSSVFGGGSSATGSGSFAFGGGSSSTTGSLFGGGQTPSAPTIGGGGQATLFGKPVGAAPVNSSVFGGAPVPSGLFSSASSSIGAPPGGGNVFGGGARLLGASPSPQQSPSLFGKPGLLGAAQTSTPVFGQVGESPNQQGGLFGKPEIPQGDKSSQGLFGQQAQPSSLLGAGSSPSSYAGTGLFGKGPQLPSAGAGNPAFPQGGEAIGQVSLYTPLSELTEVEKQVFEANEFELGKIPLRPPPRELISR